MVLLYVALGGAFGSVLRYLMGDAVQRISRAAFPYGTLVVNVLGCFLIGVLLKALMNTEASGSVRAFLVVGFCGGFTTFSAFSSETFGLFEGGAYLKATLYVAATLLLCLTATAAGFAALRATGSAINGR